MFYLIIKQKTQLEYVEDLLDYHLTLLDNSKNVAILLLFTILEGNGIVTEYNVVWKPNKTFLWV